MLNQIASYPWWMLLFTVIGVVSLVTVILTLFSGIGDRPGEASVTETCSVDDPAFLRALSGSVNCPVQEGGTVRLLNNGVQFFPAILDALRDARHSINFMVYIWEPGQVSDQLFDVLIERARAGVQVRVMIDALGGHKAPDDRIDELRRAGGKWEWFHPPRFGKFTVLHRRNHRRVIVVDGMVGFTGGAAVHDQWLGDARDPSQWRDAMVELRGCVATNLQPAFLQLWAQATGEMLVGDHFLPPAEQARQAERPHAEDITRHISVLSSPSSEEHPLRRVFWLSFRAARERILICNPYFVPDRVTKAVLKERARDGVDVRVLVPNEHIDITLIRWASHHYYEELLEAGIRIFEFQPTMIHQKLIVVDGLWSLVGSANMDVRSKELNQENILGVLDRGFAREVEDALHGDLGRAREIRLEEWRRRPWWKRVPERVISVFEEQF